jgi:signal peptidase II
VVKRSVLQFKYRVLLLLAPAVVALDQLSKRAVLDNFRLSESRSLVADIFSLTYVRNTGAAFGIFHNTQESFRVPFFVAVPVAALLAIGYVFRRISSTDYKIATALSLVVGGALGNLVDRLQWGYVVDFLDFHWKYSYHFPAFNVADMAICAGVVALLIDLVVRNEESESTAQPTLKSEMAPEIEKGETKNVSSAF